MARMARVVVPGYPHHVTHRGNRRENVFFSDGQRQQYLAFLKDYAHKAQMEVWAFCLMSNHVHLIVTPRREDSLARGVGLAHRRYAAWLNRQEKLSGHLWANRFFSTPLDDTHHWAAVRYVERNPVRAKMTARAEDYPWSSAPAHVLGREHDLLAPSRPYPGPVEDWGRWLSEPQDEADMAGLRLATRTGRPCGSDGFVRMLENLLARTLRPKKRGPEPGFRNQEQKGQLDLLETER